MSHTDEQAEFYKKLDKRRKDLDLSWVKVCRNAGVHRSVIYQLRDGRSILSDSMFLLIMWLKTTSPVHGSAQHVQTAVQNIDAASRLTHN